ncbi:MAG: prolyl oligopeptidase family serine peptidase [Candidatus Korobacteraceae bacterium]
MTKFNYPVAPTSNQVDDYHGTKVADPYRPLEDPDSAPTRAWIEAENKLTFSYLEKIPAREKIRARLKELLNYERFSVPEKRGNRYFYSHNSGLQNQSVWYWLPALDAEPKVLLDPNTLSADGTIAVGGAEISDDGELLAYSLSSSGSDWMEWHVRRVATGIDLPDVIKWSKFSGASFSKDGKGFFYSRYDEPKEQSMLRDTNYYQKLYYHKLGTSQSADALIYKRDDRKEWGFGGSVTDDGKYLIIYIGEGTDPQNRIYYKDLATPGSAVVALLDEKNAIYHFIDNDGPIFWFVTNLNAPLSRLIAIDTRNPGREHWKTIIPESKETLLGASLLDNKFVASYLKDAHSEVKVFDVEGNYLRSVETPGLGSVAGFGGKRTDKETFYSYTGFSTPATIYRYELASGKSTVFRKPAVKFNSDDYETKQIFYSSKDGTRVPMFITARKGLKLDGNNPTLLYGYGGFDISLTPAFSVGNLVWMEMGGVYAQANLRGGGEYGEPWHLAGTRLQKQNVFDDFISAAEWLIANRYTQPKKLAVRGGSNGGLLVGACLAQRPELFGAALPAVGVMDMLRFHKFTIGWAWTSDYGSSDDAEEFKALYKYSPLHNLKPGTAYPPTLIVTADHDDRVVPAHSFKFAAALQAAQAGDAPVLIRIETKAGHGAGKPISKAIEETTDEWSFLVKNLGMNEDPWAK